MAVDISKYLSKEEKIDIVKQRLKQVVAELYQQKLNLKTAVDEEITNQLNTQIELLNNLAEFHEKELSELESE